MCSLAPHTKAPNIYILSQTDTFNSQPASYKIFKKSMTFKYLILVNNPLKTIQNYFTISSQKFCIISKPTNNFPNYNPQMFSKLPARGKNDPHKWAIQSSDALFLSTVRSSVVTWADFTTDIWWSCSLIWPLYPSERLWWPRTSDKLTIAGLPSCLLGLGHSEKAISVHWLIMGVPCQHYSPLMTYLFGCKHT